MIFAWGWDVGEALESLLLLFVLWVSTRFKPENNTMAGKI